MASRRSGRRAPSCCPTRIGSPSAATMPVVEPQPRADRAFLGSERGGPPASRPRSQGTRRSGVAIEPVAAVQAIARDVRRIRHRWRHRTALALPARATPRPRDESVVLGTVGVTGQRDRPVHAADVRLRDLTLATQAGLAAIADAGPVRPPRPWSVRLWPRSSRGENHGSARATSGSILASSTAAVRWPTPAK
ncbi:MAG: hypothetical protein JWP02_2062 [Acidimicrobiales bacterium]|nr:hypothetical protein [Acidimicrobiales bacterium]